MSKITYWKCVDCNSMINDENMHEFREYRYESIDWRKYAEYCYGCHSYNPEVVLAYD